MTLDDRIRAEFRAGVVGPARVDLASDLSQVRARGRRLRQRRTTARLAVAAVVLAVVGAAVVVGGNERGETNVTTRPEGSWRSILRALPALEGSTVGFSVDDIERRSRNIGAPRPDASADDAAQDSYWDAAMEGRPSGGLLPLSSLSTADLRAELGFGPAQIERVLTMDATGATRPGLQRIDILEGTFDPVVIEAALRSDPLWSPGLTEMSHAGVRYFAWGGDGSLDVTKRSPVRPLGVGGRLVVLDKRVLVWASSTVLVEAAIDAWSGTRPRLIDDERTAALVSTVEAEAADRASFNVSQVAVSFGSRAGLPEELILALHERTGSAAEEAAASLRSSVQEGEAQGTPFRDTFEIRSLTVVGELVTARLVYTGPGSVFDAISARRVPMFSTVSSIPPTTTSR